MATMLQPGIPQQPPLPANPRLNPPRPETSQDALREAIWLRLSWSRDKNRLLAATLQTENEARTKPEHLHASVVAKR
jgi:hypothetical protein